LSATVISFDSFDEELVQALEIVVGVELDGDAAATPAAKDLHLRPERRSELGGHLGKVGIGAAKPRPGSAASCGVHHLSGESFGLADREALRDHGRERLECVRKR
jgi:hypothetical protein